MQIVIVSSMYNKDQGGATGIAVEQARELEKKGYNVFVFAGTLNNDLGWQNEDNIKIYKVRVNNYRYFVRSYTCIFNWRIQRKFKKFLKEVNPEIVHFHNLYPYLPFSLLGLAGEYAKKNFFTAHDVMTFSQYKLKHFVDKKYNIDNIEKVDYKLSLLEQARQDGKAYNPVRNMVIRFYLKKLTKIFSVSDELKKALSQNGINNVTTIHNGINIDFGKVDIKKVKDLEDKFGLKSKKIILYAGRLNKVKGSRVLEEAMKMVIKKIPEAVLLVLDNQGQVDINLDKENLVLAGGIKRSEMSNYYDLSDIVVVPSVCFDSFPTVNLEAMLCKKPVVATIYGGSREVVEDQKTGFIVNPVNIKELADKIIYLLEDLEKGKEMGKRGYEEIENNYNSDVWINNILSFY